jgi:hypothetical protein
MSWRIRLVTGVLATLAMLLFGGIVIGCAPSEEKTDARTESETIALEPNEGAAEPAATESDGPLAGTEWHLVEIQSLDDDVGSVRPHDPTLYTLSLGADGTVQMRLNCNRATGTWFSEPSGDESSPLLPTARRSTSSQPNGRWRHLCVGAARSGVGSRLSL